MVLYVFIMGLVVGSFLNVVICRLPRGESVVFPPSHCPACDARIKLYDNIPLVSYLLLGGKCRSCRARISLRYPLVELLTALAVTALFIKYGTGWDFWRSAVLLLFLVPVAFIDWDTQLVLNKLTLPGFITGALMVLIFQTEMWLRALLGAVSGGLVVLLLAALGKAVFRKDSIGFGDVKLLVLIGVFAGFPDVLICLVFGIFAASIYIVSGMIMKKITMGDIIPFGPFLAIGTLVYFLAGSEVMQWYSSFYA
ncbi:prepilin peptidase [bacterium]|nr:prepilin peptidase [bacterium]